MRVISKNGTRRIWTSSSTDRHTVNVQFRAETSFMRLGASLTRWKTFRSIDGHFRFSLGHKWTEYLTIEITLPLFTGGNRRRLDLAAWSRKHIFTRDSITAVH